MVHKKFCLYVTFNISMKLLLKFSKSFLTLLVFWGLTLGNELCLELDRQARLEITLHFIEWLACNNSEDFSILSIVMASSKASLTSSKTSSLRYFLFCRLIVFIETIISYIPVNINMRVCSFIHNIGIIHFL